jgi:hypothetical protein
VKELGYANLVIGAIGVSSLWARSWLKPAALAGSIFYGLAGASHFRRGHWNAITSVAMVSDLFISAVLLGSLGGLTTR